MGILGALAGGEILQITSSAEEAGAQRTARLILKGESGTDIQEHLRVFKTLEKSSAPAQRSLADKLAKLIVEERNRRV